MTAGNPNHDFDDELLSAYVDGELTAAERALVEERLRTDSAAAALVEELRGLSAAVKSLPREALGRDLRAAILAQASEARGDLATRGPAPSGQVEPLPPHNHWQGIRRGLVWSAFAIAATLLIGLFQPAEQDRDPVTLAKAERKIESADSANRQEEHSGAAEQQLADGQGSAIDHVAADDRLPPGLRGGMSAAPAIVPAERPADPLNESLGDAAGDAIASNESLEPTEPPAVTLGALDLGGTSGGAPSSSVASAPASMGAGDPQFAAAAANAGQAGGALGGEARPMGGAKINAPMTVTLRTTGRAGATRLEQILAESRLSLDSVDKPIEEPASKFSFDAAGPAATDARPDGASLSEAARITDGVIVEATSQQIEAILAKCRADRQTFAAVEVQAPSASDRLQYFAEGAFGRGGGATEPPLSNRNGKQLLWARQWYAMPRDRRVGEGEVGKKEKESVAAKSRDDDSEANSPTEDLDKLAMRKLAAPVDGAAPLAAQPEQAATRSSLMTPPSTEPSAVDSESRASSEQKGEQPPIAADPAPRIRVLFLLEPAEAPAAPATDAPAKGTE